MSVIQKKLSPVILRTGRRLQIHRALFGTSIMMRHQHNQQSGNDNESLYSSEKQTHFGFETVSEHDKSQKVRTVFENVADTYDVMNDCMSAGVHRVWKDIFVHRLHPGSNTKLIDVAGGTGDIAFRFLKYTKFLPGLSSFSTSNSRFSEVESQYNRRTEVKRRQHNTHPNDEREVVVCDINPRMLEVGQKRTTDALTPSQSSRISWLEGDAENLHTIPDNTFDAYTIAFGIRNCVHIDKVVAEAHRVLKRGGRFMCLEFSHVNNPLIKWAYDQYSFEVIPAMGQVIAGDWDSYQYLVESIRKFPNQENFKKIIQAAGFRCVTYENLTFGVAAIHSGFKL